MEESTPRYPLSQISQVSGVIQYIMPSSRQSRLIRQQELAALSNPRPNLSFIHSNMVPSPRGTPVSETSPIRDIWALQ